MGKAHRLGDISAARAALEVRDWSRALDILVPIDAAGALDAEGLEALGRAAFATARLDNAMDAYQRAHAACARNGDDVGAGRCATFLAEANFANGQPAIGSGWLQRARRALGRTPECETHGQFLIVESWGVSGGGDLDAALELARAAAEIGRRCESADIEARGLMTIGNYLLSMGDVASGLAHMDEAMLFVIEGRLSPMATGVVYCQMIFTCEELGDLHRANEWTGALASWVESEPYAIFPAMCQVHRFRLLDRRGAWSDAEALAQEATVVLVAQEDAGNAADAQAIVGEIRRRLGDFGAAEAAFRRAEELCGSPRPGLALLRLAQGQLDAADAIITRALADVPPLARGRLLPARVQISLAAGDTASAAEATDELESIASSYRSPELTAAAATCRGRVQLATGDCVAAAATLHRAVTMWHDLEVPYEEATSRALLAQGCRDSGDHDGATASFTAATRLFDALGAVVESRRLRDDAAGPRDLPCGLSEREAEVLRLVAAGQPNKQIAAELFLSDKTVARHVSNIFTKIGVNSRAAATAFAFENGIAGRSS